MRYFALFSLTPLAFGIFASAAPVPGGRGGDDDALVGRNLPGEHSDGGSNGSSLIDLTVLADVGFVLRQRQGPTVGADIIIGYNGFTINRHREKPIPLLAG